MEKRDLSIAAPIRLTLSSQLKLMSPPDDLRAELMEKLTLLNPKWLENDRLGRWNRGTQKVLKFYSRAKSGDLTIPRGYARSLLLRLREKGVPWDLRDSRRTFPEVEFTFKGELKPFQEKATADILAKDFGTLCAPTGSGKTVMALYLVAKRRQPTVIVVHTKDLAMQWIRQISLFLDIPEDQVGLLGGGKKTIGEKVTVALVQSLYNEVDQVAARCGFIIVDECHRVPSRTFTEALTEFDSKYMLGLSATPFRRDGLSQLIFWHLGDIHHEIEKPMLVQSGDVLKAAVVWRETEFKPFHDPVSEYSKMLMELTVDDARNRLITDDVAKEVGQKRGICLVLTDRKKHADTLYFLLRYKHHLACALLTGDLSSEERKHVVEDLEQGTVDVLVATGQLVGEGFDCKGLTTLFFATPVRFSGRVLQYLGRVLRPAPNKKEARVYDYVDVHVDVLCAGAKARAKIYTNKRDII